MENVKIQFSFMADDFFTYVSYTKKKKKKSNFFFETT